MSKVKVITGYEKFLVAEVYKEIGEEMFFMGYLTADEENNFLDEELEALGYKIVAL